MVELERCLKNARGCLGGRVPVLSWCICSILLSIKDFVNELLALVSLFFMSFFSVDSVDFSFWAEVIYNQDCESNSETFIVG